MNATQQRPTYTVRAVHPEGHPTITGQYTAANAATALAAFAADHPATCNTGRPGWRLTCVTPAKTERPTRRLLSWEKDTDTFDNWLADAYTAGASLADRLNWEPQYCTRTTSYENHTRVGWCGTPLAVQYDNSGVPYAGCPTCAPGHKDPTAAAIYAQHGGSY